MNDPTKTKGLGLHQKWKRFTIETHLNKILCAVLPKKQIPAHAKPVATHKTAVAVPCINIDTTNEYSYDSGGGKNLKKRTSFTNTRDAVMMKKGEHLTIAP